MSRTWLIRAVGFLLLLVFVLLFADLHNRLQKLQRQRSGMPAQSR